MSDPARVNISKAVFPPSDVKDTHTVGRLRPSRAREEGLAADSSELPLLSPHWAVIRSALASSLHGTPELAACRTAAVLHGLPSSGDPLHLQGQVQIR